MFKTLHAGIDLDDAGKIISRNQSKTSKASKPNLIVVEPDDHGFKHFPFQDALVRYYQPTSYVMADKIEGYVFLVPIKNRLS